MLRRGPGEEVVDAENACVLPQQPLAQMRPEKAGPAGDQHALFKVHVCFR